MGHFEGTSHDRSFKTEKEPKMNMLNSGSSKRKMQMRSRDKYLIHMLFSHILIESAITYGHSDKGSTSVLIPKIGP